jgi:hypothetical protein
MIAQRQPVPEESAIAKALDYSLKRWIVLTRYPADASTKTRKYLTSFYGWPS